LTAEVKNLQNSISEIRDDKGRKLEIMDIEDSESGNNKEYDQKSPSPTRKPAPTPYSGLLQSAGTSPFRASMPSLGLFNIPQRPRNISGVINNNEDNLNTNPSYRKGDSRSNNNDDENDTLTSSEVSKEEDFGEEGEFGDLDSVLSSMEDHLSEYVRKNSILENNFVGPGVSEIRDEPPVSSAHSTANNNDDIVNSVNAEEGISMESLTESLLVMKSACIEVEEKQRRRGGSLLGPEPVVSQNFVPPSPQKSNLLPAPQLQPSPIHSPGPRFYNDNANDEFEISDKGREVPTEFKNAIDSVLSQFNDQFSAIEQQMQTLNSNMQQIQSKKAKKQLVADNSPIIEDIPDEDLKSPPRNGRQSISFAPEVRGERANGAKNTSHGDTFAEDDDNHHEMEKNSLTSIAKNHSPTVSNAYAATPHFKKERSSVMTSFQTPQEQMLMGGSPRTFASSNTGLSSLSKSPRYSTYASRLRESFSRRRDSATKHISVGTGMTPQDYDPLGVMSPRKPRSPFQTRNRSDDYFRSLQQESSRRMSFSKEMNEHRRSAGKLRLRKDDENDLDSDHQSGILNAKSHALYEISDKAMERNSGSSNGEKKAGKGTVSSTPTRTYVHRHRNSNYKLK